MPICIECCFPVSHLYTSYSKADDRALGKGVRLTQCPRCHRFADKYVEHDFVVLFIDLVLIKPQVYRHLLFNRLGREDDKVDRSIIRLGILILLFDVYLSWARIEKSAAIVNSKLSHAPIVVQYVFFLTVNALATLAHHLMVRALAYLLVSRSASSTSTSNQIQKDADTSASLSDHKDANPPGPTAPVAATPASSTSSQPTTNNVPVRRPSRPLSWNSATGSLARGHSPHPHPRTPPLSRSSTSATSNTLIQPPSPASPNAISTALLVSSCTKLFPILLVIWNPDLSADSGSKADAPLASVPSTSVLSRSIIPMMAPTTFPANALAQRASPVASEPMLSLTSPASWGSSPVLQPFLSLLFSLTNTHLVLLNNVEALYILLDCGYVRAAAITIGGQLARWVVERFLLSLVGL